MTAQRIEDTGNLDKALTTLGVDTNAMSRQDAVGQSASLAVRKNKGAASQQKNMTNSSTFSKKGNAALNAKDGSYGGSKG